MKTLKRFYKRFVMPVIQVRPRNVLGYVRYMRMVWAYRKLGGKFTALWPILGEDTATTAVDPHYFHQGAWTARHISHARPSDHVDVGSQTDLVGFLAALARVIFVDLRPLDVRLPNLDVVRGSVLDLPFADAAVASISCLHVAEHIGLGRYGDPLDPLGTRKACTELARVLAPGGTLYFSLPIGRERTEFNAHRIHRPATIARYFPGLRLAEFSAVDDHGRLITDADITAFDNARYACGLFRFVRDSKNL